MRILLAPIIFISFCATAAIEKPKDTAFAFSFKETPLLKVIDYYSARTGQKFVLDGSVTNNVNINIVEPSKVSAKEAFNLLSAALALNSVAVSNRDGTLVLASAKNMQRSYIPVVTDLPPLQPEKLITWVVVLKNSDANQLSQQVRVLTSKDGELVTYGQNRLLVTDWVSSLYRVKDLIAQLDKPVENKAPVAPLSDKKSF